MPLPLLVPIIYGICWCGTVIGVGYVCKKGHDAYVKGQKTKEKKYDIKGKSIEAERKRLENLDNRDKQINKDLDKGKEEENNLQKAINDINKKLNDKNISKKEEEELRGKLGFLQTQLDDLKKNNKSLRDEKEKNRKEREKAYKIISDIGKNIDEKHWIWDFLTLENILLMGGCYVMYKLLKEEKK